MTWLTIAADFRLRVINQLRGPYWGALGRGDRAAGKIAAAAVFREAARLCMAAAAALEEWTDAEPGPGAGN